MSKPQSASVCTATVEPVSVERTIDPVLVCSRCGAVLPFDAKFCPYDGSELVVVERATPRRDSLVGFIVDERYEVLQLLGEGGMGCVYRVRHRVLGRLFALKALRLELAYDQVTAERFVQEARAAAAIAHPNVVTINDFGLLATGQPYFVMELLEGRTLCSLLRERGSFSPYEAVSVAREVASALGAAHDAGIIHRDLKPDNVVLLNPTGALAQLKVLDFGLAMVHGNHRLTRDGVVFGTPQYMSPEQATGEPLDARVDVYALGIVLYEMLTGRAPFESDSYMGVLTKQLYAEPAAPSHVNSALLAYPELEDIVLRCLKKNREERFASMQQLSLALDAILAVWGGPLSSDGLRPRLASVRPPMESRVRRRRRRYRLVGYAAVGALALVLALALLYGHWVRSSAGPSSAATPFRGLEDGSSSKAAARAQTARPDLQRVSAVAPRRAVVLGASTGSLTSTLSREPSKNSPEKAYAGRSGGRVTSSPSSRRTADDPVSPPNSNDQAKLGSSEISDPWAQ